MENDEKDNIIESENDDLDLDLEDEKPEVKAEKPKLSDEDKLAKYKGIVARLEKKTGKSEPEVKTETTKSGELDYGQKAYLRAEGIKRGEEESLVQKIMSQTGKSLEDVLDSKYFQAELKEMREAIATKEATPTGSKRSGTSSKDSVEYWIAKGELPPADQIELRRKVVNAKLKSQTETNVFSPHPIVGKF